MLLAALSGALILSALPVLVEAESCPSGPEVEQALVSMLPQVAASTRRDVARVTKVAGRGLRIELVNPDAAMVAEREMEVDGTCAELASLAAVVIATWESDVHPEFTQSHAEPIPGVSAAPSLATPVVPTGSPSFFSYDIAAGPSLSWAGSLAAGGAISGTWIARGTGLGLRVFAAGEATRSLALESGGQAVWRRWMGSLEADWRLVRAPANFDVHAGLALGWLSAVGAGFSPNQSRTSLSPGLALGGRSSWAVSRHLAVYLDLAGIYWTRTQTVSSASDLVRREVPHVQVLASVGVASGKSASSP